MEKYLFIKVAGTLILGKASREDVKWIGSFDADSIRNLNIIVRDENIKIVLLDAPRGHSSSDVKLRFIEEGFEHQKSIVGQVAHPPSIVVNVIGFPIILGNCIKHWVDTYLVYPHNLDPDNRVKYEVWGEVAGLEDPQFLGMKTNLYGKHFCYKIVGADYKKDLLASQQDHYLESNEMQGIKFDTAKNLALAY